MTYATLMVHLDLDHPSDSRIEVAEDLAETFSATLIGIAAGDPRLPYYAEGGMAQDLVEQDRAAIEQRLAEMEQRFRELAAKRAIEAEWRGALARPTDYVAAQARAADLVIVGTGHRGALLDPLRELDAAALVMQAGRPIFVVPPKAGRLDLSSVLIGWKDTREARRAVHDALPLLGRAREVNVVEVVERGGDRLDALARVADVVAWLGRHGIEASHMVPSGTDDAPERLEETADQVGASLIVAGAYGHSRLGEWMFGGVSRDLLAHARRCALLAH